MTTNSQLLVLTDEAYKKYITKKRQYTLPSQALTFTNQRSTGPTPNADLIIQNEHQKAYHRHLNTLGFMDSDGKLSPTIGLIKSFSGISQQKNSVDRLFRGPKSKKRKQPSKLNIPKLKLEKSFHTDDVTKDTLRAFAFSQLDFGKSSRDDKISIALTERIIKPKGRRKPGRRLKKSKKQQSCISTRPSTTQNLRRPKSHMIKTKSPPAISTERRKSVRSEIPGEFSDLYDLLHTKNQIKLPKKAPNPNLNQKIMKLVRNRPSKLYQILNNQEEKMNNYPENEDWTDTHEEVFRSLLRKTKSFNSIVKTRIFREKLKQENLQTISTIQNMQWKFDKHSPYINDLDYQDEEYLQSGLVIKTKDNRKPISNIVTSIREIPPSVDPYEKHIQELLQATGEKEAVNVHKLENMVRHMEQVKAFKQALKIFKMLYVWEKSPNLFEKSKNYIALNILNNCHYDMKTLNRTRYSYLSAKIARQRAEFELQEKLLNFAEEKRKELRARQARFLNQVAVAKGIVRQIYGNGYKLRPKRVLRNTENAIGSPLFRQSMVKLGYLPAYFCAKPQRIKSQVINVLKLENVQPPSIDNQSQ